jgi:transposase
LDVSKELIRIAIKKQGYTKKNVKYYGSPSNLPEKTKLFLETRQKYLQNKDLIFSIDETSFGQRGVQTKGYSPKNQKLYIKTKLPRMTSVSSICCVSNQQIISHKELQGSVNTIKFVEFLKTLTLPKNSVILLDNVRFHHSRDVKEYCDLQSWILLFVPPYSPWFNPIELCFSIIKRQWYKSLDISEAYSALTKSHLEKFFDKSLHCLGAF